MEHDACEGSGGPVSGLQAADDAVQFVGVSAVQPQQVVMLACRVKRFHNGRHHRPMDEADDDADGSVS
jgi:hypothetical protein